MKNVLLTGISKGLGLETAKILLEKGYYVYGISRGESPELLKLKERYPEALKTMKK
jgi:3-oxoacyl-[acyl-carrier protein] reductase